MPENAAGEPDVTGEVRSRLRRLVDERDLVLELLVVTDHRSESAVVYEMPISARLAGQLLEQVAEAAGAAAEAELRPSQPGFSPTAQQWLFTPVAGTALAGTDSTICGRGYRQYGRDTAFGRKNVLVLNVRTAAGADVARMYQGFSPDKALIHRKKILAVWTDDRYTSLEAEPLVIDRGLRLVAVGDQIVMKSAGAFELLFGPLPDLRERAVQTYTATLGKLDIAGGEQLAAACESDINMMHKLVSIERRLEQPGYAEALDMPHVLEFLDKNPHIDVQIDRTGDVPQLVHDPSPQRRWALLKLLDDDFLRSDLTNINYEANSKSEVPG